jgi:tRNA A37 threonylcarbamoyladenosine synthetase subunit TsaC/SUA5/YrdC
MTDLFNFRSVNLSKTSSLFHHTERKKIMKRIPWIVIALLIMMTTTLLVTTIGFSGDKAPTSPKVIAVKFHADW